MSDLAPAFFLPTPFFPFGEGFTPPQLLNMNTTLLSPLRLSGNPSGNVPPPLAQCFFTHAMSVSWVFVFSQHAALAEALASFSGFRSFRIVLPLQRWPHFRASARSESCSRCSAGVISSAMPRHAMQCYVVLRCAMPCLQLQCYNLQCVTTQCYAILSHATL